MARDRDCELTPGLATALANLVRLYYSGRWKDRIPTPTAKAIDYDREPGGITLLQHIVKQEMQSALEQLKLFHPEKHRTLLKAMGNNLDPTKALHYYESLCTLWKLLLKVYNAHHKTTPEKRPEISNRTPKKGA